MPNTFVATNYDTQAADLQRRQKLADLLQQQSMEPIDVPTYLGIQAQIAPSQMLAKILGGYSANKQQQDVMQRQQALQQQKAQAVQEVTGNILNSLKANDKDTALQHAMSDAGRVALQESPALASIVQTALAPKPSAIGEVKPNDYTPDSLVKFNQSHNYADLEPVVKPQKEATTTLAKLMSERDALDKNDPRRKTYDLAIAKESTTAANNTPEISGDALNDLADRYIAGDKTAMTGLGRNAGLMVKFQNTVAQKLKANGADPTVIAQAQRNLAAASKTEYGFTSGKEANLIRSMNTAAQHLDHLDEFVQGLNSGDSKLINQAQQWWQEQTGSPIPNDKKLIAQLVGDELQKAAAGAPGGESERQALMERLSGPYSPQVLHDAIQHGKTLIRGQLGSLKQQYQAGTGNSNFEDRFLTDEAKSAFSSASKSSAMPPAEAIKQLKENVPTTFKNGQTWTLKNGQPTRIQ
jgi:hypothetical protein